MRLIPVFGENVLRPGLEPEHIYRAAQEAPQDEQREALEGYAVDLITIRALPELDGKAREDYLFRGGEGLKEWVQP